jgi:PhnB protein
MLIDGPLLHRLDLPRFSPRNPAVGVRRDLHLVGDGEDIVAQLGVGDAAFWVAPLSATMKGLSPRAIDGATSRTLLVVDEPDTVAQQAIRAGAKETSPVGDEHGWRLGRIIDPFGHEWEIGKPLGTWPPT